MKEITPQFFSLAGASEYLGGGLSVRTLRRLITEPGGIPHYRAGQGKILIPKDDLESWLQSRRQEPQDPDQIADDAVREVMNQ